MAVKQHQDNWYALNNLGVLHFSFNQPQQALAMFEQLYAQAPEYWDGGGITGFFSTHWNFAKPPTLSQSVCASTALMLKIFPTSACINILRILHEVNPPQDNHALPLLA